MAETGFLPQVGEDHQLSSGLKHCCLMSSSLPWSWSCHKLRRIITSSHPDSDPVKHCCIISSSLSWSWSLIFDPRSSILILDPWSYSLTFDPDKHYCLIPSPPILILVTFQPSANSIPLSPMSGRASLFCAKNKSRLGAQNRSRKCKWEEGSVNPSEWKTDSSFFWLQMGWKWIFLGCLPQSYILLCLYCISKIVPVLLCKYSNT